MSGQRDAGSGPRTLSKGKLTEPKLHAREQNETYVVERIYLLRYWPHNAIRTGTNHVQHGLTCVTRFAIFNNVCEKYQTQLPGYGQTRPFETFNLTKEPVHTGNHAICVVITCVLWG